MKKLARGAIDHVRVPSHGDRAAAIGKSVVGLVADGEFGFLFLQVRAIAAALE